MRLTNTNVLKLSKNYHLGNETTGKALDSAVFLPALPFVVAGSLAREELWASQVSKKEANPRSGILETRVRIKSYRGLFRKMDQVQHLSFENSTNTIEA